MTESPQPQPEQQSPPPPPPPAAPSQPMAQPSQPAYTGQMPAYQQYAPAPSLFDRLPMNQTTFWLAASGGLLLMVATLIHGAGSSLILITRVFSPMALMPIYLLIVLTAVAITTGPKFRNTLRAVVSGVALLELGFVFSMFMSSPSDISSSGEEGAAAGLGLDAGPPESYAGADVVGILLYLVAVGLLVAATFTMREPQPAQPAPVYHTGTFQAVPQAPPPPPATSGVQYQNPPPQ